ncbi:MAG: aspartate carbamoyltransferase catalytic subunit [Hydrogenibacillus sp.]|nr:aspartate carbamoyltransferase catalytic subunit [Hydrogenibacillus sp.]
MRALISLDDWPLAQIRRVLRRAAAWKAAFKRARGESEFGRMAEDKGTTGAFSKWDEMRFERTVGRRTVALAFFEPSTRTRLSFELAAKRLGADVVDLDVGRSSVQKGEDIAETLATLEAMGAEAIVVRTTIDDLRPYGEALQRAALVSAGAGMAEHPTQALLDVLTMLEAFGSLEGKTVAVIGDVRHSRVAASHLRLLPRLGARLVLAGPPALLEREDGRSATAIRAPSVDEAIEAADAVIVLRLQKERLTAVDRAMLGGDVDRFLARYLERYGLSAPRAARLKPSGLILHPGPVWPDVEIARAVFDDPRARIRVQVENGVFVRMAVLAEALAISSPEEEAGSAVPAACSETGDGRAPVGVERAPHYT